MERFLHEQYVVDIRFRRGEHLTHQATRTKLHCTSSGCKAVITCKRYKICNIQYTYMFVVFTTYISKAAWKETLARHPQKNRPYQNVLLNDDKSTRNPQMDP